MCETSKVFLLFQKKKIKIRLLLFLCKCKLSVKQQSYLHGPDPPINQPTQCCMKEPCFNPSRCGEKCDKSRVGKGQAIHEWRQGLPI